MERIKQRLADAGQALRTLQEALQEDPSVLVRDAAIKRFEYTFEALWKAAQALLLYEGFEVNSPRGSVRASLEAGLLTPDQAEGVLTSVDDRNLTVHVYREAVAVAIYRRLPVHASLMRVWLSGLERRAKEAAGESPEIGAGTNPD